MKKLKASQQYLKVEKDQRTLKLCIANLNVPQGIEEFECDSKVLHLVVEVMINDQLLSEIHSIQS
mgnify:CR=1 FL=1